MKENDFNLDTTVREKQVFLKKIRIVFTAALFLTGVLSFLGLMMSAWGIKNRIWLQMGLADFVWNMVLTAVMILVFVSLVKIAADEQPFSRTLTWSIRMIGILLLTASFVIPRLEGYQSSGYEFLSRGSFVLIDAAIFIPGLLFVILGNIIMEGFSMQKEMDEIL